MTLEIKEKGSREFYKESINVALQYKSLLKDPKRKLKDYFKMYSRYLIICVVLLVLLIAMNMAWGMDQYSIAVMAVMAITVVLCGAYLMNLNNTLKGMLGDNRTSYFTMDDNGVELRKSEEQMVRMSWENLAFARVFNESICFLPKDGYGFVISTDRRYQDLILGWLAENKPEAKLIR